MSTVTQIYRTEGNDDLPRRSKRSRIACRYYYYKKEEKSHFTGQGWYYRSVNMQICFTLGHS